MHVNEVIPSIFNFFSYISSFKTYSTGYFRKQQNETGYFCGMTLCINTWSTQLNKSIKFFYFLFIKVECPLFRNTRNTICSSYFNSRNKFKIGTEQSIYFIYRNNKIQYFCLFYVFWNIFQGIPWEVETFTVLLNIIENVQ